MTQLERPRAWQKPRLRDSTDSHRPVGWIELFFDLVFVVIIAVLTQDLRSAGTAGLLPFVLEFVAVFWVWNGFTCYTERFESNGLETRLFFFLALLAVAGFAVWGRHGFGANYPGLVAVYLLARGLNIALWIRAAIWEPRFRAAAASFTVGYLAAGALLLASLAATDSWRMPLWAAAVAVDIFSPAVSQRFQVALPLISRNKFPERFGLFTLILLGEVLSGVILGVSSLNAEAPISPSTLLLALLGLTICFGMWWLYFDYVARRPTRPAFLPALVWVYLHIATNAAVVVTGTGITLAIEHAAEGPLPTEARLMMLGGLAVVLAGTALIELTLDRDEHEPTHRIASPAMKLAMAGLLAVVAGVADAASDVLLTLLALAALVTTAAYGAVVYYRRRPGDSAP